MEDKKYKWYKIAETLLELPFEDNSLVEIQVAGRNICIAKSGDSLFACSAKCPHAGGIMAEGFLDKEGHIVCPVHRYKFSFKTGRDITGEGYHLKIYPIELKESGIFLGIKEGGLFSWLK
jgi:nitrite reductase/ring-hydroxylating ferredoxin subunit